MLNIEDTKRLKKPLNGGHAWFLPGFHADHPGQGSQTAVVARVNTLTDQIIKKVQEVLDKYTGIERTRIHAEGFSQGAVMALMLLTHRSQILSSVSATALVATGFTSGFRNNWVPFADFKGVEKAVMLTYNREDPFNKPQRSGGGGAEKQNGENQFDVMREMVLGGTNFSEDVSATAPTLQTEKPKFQQVPRPLFSSAAPGVTEASGDAESEEAAALTAEVLTMSTTDYLVDGRLLLREAVHNGTNGNAIFGAKWGGHCWPRIGEPDKTKKLQSKERLALPEGRGWNQVVMDFFRKTGGAEMGGEMDFFRETPQSP